MSPRRLFSLFRRKPHERAGFELYTAAVAAARQPWFFAPPPGGAGAPDTLNGRFDVVGLHVALLIRRLRSDPDPRGTDLAQAVFDAMFADMDINLREMGVGDMVIGKRVKRMWEAFHGRARAYESALDATDGAALQAALARNVWRTDAGAADAGATQSAPAGPLPAGGTQALAAQAMGVAAALAAQPLAQLLAGQVQFPPPPHAATAAAAPAEGVPAHAA